MNKMQRFLEACAEYERRTGMKPTDVRMARADFDDLAREAKGRATYESKGPRLPRNQMVIDGVLVVGEDEAAVAAKESV